MTKKNRQVITAASVAVIPLFFGSKYFKSLGASSDQQGSSTIEALYENRQPGVMVEFDGLIVKKTI
jgi:hypothetical protein